MRSIIAVVLGVLSAAAILGTSASASASMGDCGGDDVLLTKEQWEGVMSTVEECGDRGYDSYRTVETVVSELEVTVGAVLDAKGVSEESAGTVIESVAWMAVQTHEISEAVADLQYDGATRDEYRDAIGPMVDHYKSLSAVLAETLEACGLVCYIPEH